MSILLLLLSACLLPQIDDDLYLTDRDEDGYAAVEGDCEPEDPDVHPGADERCDNGRDDNCNGEENEDPVDGSTFYRDNDGDGVGDSEQAVRACTPLDGYVTDGGDCNDENGDVTYLTDWYRDLDGDSFGDPATTKVDCDPGDGWVLNADDCNDDDPDRFPGNEWYEDVDEDGFGGEYIGQACDGEPGAVANDQDCDDNDPEEFPDQSWYPDNDEDTWGTGETPGVSCERPGAKWAVQNGDCDDSKSGVNPDASEVCNDGLDNDCNPDTACAPTPINDVAGETTDWTLLGSAADRQAGRALLASPLLPGAKHSLLWSDARDGVSILFGSNIGLSSPASDADADTTLDQTGSEVFGVAMAVVDADHAGAHEVLSADYLDGANGKIELFAPNTSTGNLSWSSQGTFVPAALSAFVDADFGYSMASCSGFGGGEYLVGVPGYLLDSGSVALLSAFPGGSVETTLNRGSNQIVASIDGQTATGMRFGTSIACLKRGNGVLAAAIGAGKSPATGIGNLVPGTQRGAVYVFSADSEWASDREWNQANVQLLGPTGTTARFGEVLANAGDFNGDGHDDLLVAAPEFGAGPTAGSGKVYLLSGAIPSGTLTDVDNLPAEYILGTFSIAQIGARIGSALASGDFNGDGRSDIAIGAPYYNPDGSTADGGVVWVFLGGHTDKVHHDLLASEDAGRLKYYSSQTGAWLGHAVALGDVDDDGFDDLLMGAPGFNATASNGGAIFLVYGSGQ